MRRELDVGRLHRSMALELQLKRLARDQRIDAGADVERNHGRAVLDLGDDVAWPQAGRLSRAARHHRGDQHAALPALQLDTEPRLLAARPRLRATDASEPVGG